MTFNFSKALYWLGLVHVLLGAAIEHTKHHNTLAALDEGIGLIEGLAGSNAGAGTGALQGGSPVTPAGAVSPIAASSS